MERHNGTGPEAGQGRGAALGCFPTCGLTCRFPAKKDNSETISMTNSGLRLRQLVVPAYPPASTIPLKIKQKSPLWRPRLPPDVAGYTHT
jgi:hypothetical protein